MVDIAPELLSKIGNEFYEYVVYGDNTKWKDYFKLQEALEAGEVTYKQANDYSAIIGEMLAEAIRNNVNGDILPDGHMYYNIAQKILRNPFVEEYTLVTEYTAAVQEILNQKAGINVAAQVPGFNENRYKGLIDFITSADKYDDVEEMFLQDVINFAQYYTDQSVYENAKFQYEAGMQAKIVRTAEFPMTKYYKPKGSKKSYPYQVPCQWCKDLEGSYEYPLYDPEVYQRHRDCRCIVEYMPTGVKKKQNVWSKKWYETETPAEMIASAKAMLGEE